MTCYLIAKREHREEDECWQNSWFILVWSGCEYWIIYFGYIHCQSYVGGGGFWSYLTSWRPVLMEHTGLGISRAWLCSLMNIIGCVNTWEGSEASCLKEHNMSFHMKITVSASTPPLKSNPSSCFEAHRRDETRRISIHKIPNLVKSFILMLWNPLFFQLKRHWLYCCRSLASTRVSGFRSKNIFPLKRGYR